MSSTAAPTDPSPRRSFRPSSRRRVRIALGVTIAAIAVGGNVLVYSALDQRTDVIQFTRDIHAGEQIGSGDVRIVDVDVDLTETSLVAADGLGTVVDQYARTFIPAGALASPVLVRPSPAVTPGAAVVPIAPAGGLLPSGIVERARVALVLGDGGETPLEARVVALDRDGALDGVISVELPAADAARVAASDEVHVVLIESRPDPLEAADEVTSESTEGAMD